MDLNVKADFSRLIDVVFQVPTWDLFKYSQKKTF